MKYREYSKIEFPAEPPAGKIQAELARWAGQAAVPARTTQSGSLFGL
jgi:hypothetical protein